MDYKHVFIQKSILRISKVKLYEKRKYLADRYFKNYFMKYNLQISIQSPIMWM